MGADLEHLIAELSQPSAYPYPVDTVEVRQTHISAVFLAGPYAYKVKKPVDLGFLDFSTPARREHFCHEEVRLNRRLAPRVYLGVVPIARDGPGSRLRVEGAGPAREHAVKMLRLPEEQQLRTLVEHDRLEPPLVAEVARRLLAFHRAAAGGPEVAALARFEPVRRNLIDNFVIGASQVGWTVTAAVFARLRELTEAALERSRSTIEARAAALVPRDGHGDLHLDHVYHFPGRAEPDDLAIIDCIEFTTRFRHLDPVADLAFLAMDLGFRGRPDLAAVLTDAYLDASRDPEGRALLPLYLSYRSAVRAKVNGIAAAEPEVPEGERRALALRAQAHWLYALGELEEPARRPGLVLVGGLPGTGKSTLARDLGPRLGFTVIASDRVRKELAGSGAGGGPGRYQAGIYTPEWTERTYATCLARAEEVIRAGGRALVDASFCAEGRRRAFLDRARALGVRSLLLVCSLETAFAHARLAARKDDISDADIAVHEQMRAAWEEPSGPTRRALVTLSTAGAEAAVKEAVAALAAAGLA